jgi:hypothetical protein
LRQNVSVQVSAQTVSPSSAFRNSLFLMVGRLATEDSV